MPNGNKNLCLSSHGWHGSQKFSYMRRNPAKWSHTIGTRSSSSRHSSGSLAAAPAALRSTRTLQSPCAVPRHPAGSASSLPSASTLSLAPVPAPALTGCYRGAEVRYSTERAQREAEIVYQAQHHDREGGGATARWVYASACPRCCAGHVYGCLHRWLSRDALHFGFQSRHKHS